MVFARNALAFGPGNGRNSIGLTATCRKRGARILGGRGEGYRKRRFTFEIYISPIFGYRKKEFPNREVSP
jgi:hypothetical protein